MMAKAAAKKSARKSTAKKSHARRRNVSELFWARVKSSGSSPLTPSSRA